MRDRLRRPRRNDIRGSMSLTKDYTLPSAAHAKLDAMVDGIVEKPGDMIDLKEFEALQDRLNVRETLRTLPDGLSEDDFAGILHLALLTECATETYGDAFSTRAKAYNAPWLGRFNETVWVPDELTHHAPYKFILLSMGFAESELDRDIKHTQEIDFIHKGGDTPAHVTTFGVIQEYLTDNWHGLIADLLKKAAPDASYMATRIKRRETLHTVWYRDMTALQVEANPRLIQHVGEALLAFNMPGNQLVPELQAQVGRWMPLMGANFEQITKDMVRHFYVMLGDTRNAGAMLLRIAEEKGITLGPITPSVVRQALDRLGGPGYGLIGEALLQKVGLDYMFRPERGAQDSAFALYGGVYERVRGLARTWIADQIDFNLDVA
jgi:hypothetical protein